MAFKLTQAEAAEKAACVESLRLAFVSVEEAVATFNAGLETLRTALTQVVDAYNGEIDAASVFVARVAQRLAEEIGAKSPRWQEGKVGERATAFQEAWGDLDLEALEVDLPPDLDDPDDPGAWLVGAPDVM